MLLEGVPVGFCEGVVGVPPEGRVGVVPEGVWGVVPEGETGGVAGKPGRVDAGAVGSGMPPGA